MDQLVQVTGGRNPDTEATSASEVAGGIAWCITHLNILCPFFAGVGAVVSAPIMVAKQVESNAIDDANVRFTEFFKKHATSTALQKKIETHFHAPIEPQADFPRLIVRMDTVNIYLEPKGVLISMGAQVYAVLKPGAELLPTNHWVRLPTRTRAEWWDSDAMLLRSDIEIALEHLSRHIVSTYLPLKIQ